jgi:RNA polymerase sigma-70 factor (ECF subfamily)
VSGITPLASLFVSQLPDPLHSPPDADALEATLRRALDDARAAWPAVALPPEEFVRQLAARVARGGLADLATLQAADLYIACACAAGVPGALPALEARYFGILDVALRRMRLEVAPDDVKQELRLRLFVSDGGATPRIDQYNGKGDLASWLRVSATRVALRLARRRRPDAPTDAERLSELAVRDVEPELRHLRATLRPIVREAFAAALAALDERQRTLLSHHYVDALPTDRIGAIYGVHRATAARWVVQARAALLGGLRERVAHRLDSDVDEVDSLLRYVKSHLDLTLSRLLPRGASVVQ